MFRPPLESLSCFFNYLTHKIDFFSRSYENFIAMDDFHSQPTDSILRDFMKLMVSMVLIQITVSKGKVPVLIGLC